MKRCRGGLVSSASVSTLTHGEAHLTHCTGPQWLTASGPYAIHGWPEEHVSLKSSRGVP